MTADPGQADGQETIRSRPVGALKEILLFFALILLRFTAFGFTYYKQLDDYIQYKIYADTPLLTAYARYGLLGARPLSNTLDIVLWGKLWGCLIGAVCLIALLLSLACFLLRRLFAGWFGTGMLFSVIAVLLPLSMEGTYWLSASTRVVTGLFFAALSAWLWQRFLDGASRMTILPAVLSQLAAMFSYEQTLLLSAALTVTVIVCGGKGKGRRRFIPLIAMLLSGFSYFIFIGFFRGGPLYGSSYGLAPIFSAYYWREQVPMVLSLIGDAFGKAGWLTLAVGFRRGVRMLLTPSMIGFWAVLLILCVLLFLLTQRLDTRSQKAKNVWLPLLCGLFLFLAPLAVFFLMEQPYVSLRSTVCSLPGLALMADALLRMAYGKKGRAMTVSLLALFCCIACVSELADYRDTTKSDTQAITAILSSVPEEERTGKIGIFGMEMTFLTEQNCSLNEHITGVTSSSWALTGAVNATADGTLTGKVTFVPLPLTTPMCYAWNYESCRLDSFDRLYLYEKESGSLLPLTLSPDGDGYLLSDSDGHPILTAFPAENGVWQTFSCGR